MPLRSPRPTAAPDDTLVPLADHPEYAALQEYARALGEALRERERAIEIDGLTVGLHAHPDGPRRRLLADRLSALRAQQPAPKAAPPEAGWPLASSAAARLLAGEALPPALNRGAMLAKLRDEAAVIEGELRATGHRMEALRDEESFRAALALKARHDAIKITIYKSALALAAAISAERQLFADLLRNGYSVRSDVLRPSNLDGARRIGEMGEYSSQISEFRRRLEREGVI